MRFRITKRKMFIAGMVLIISLVIFSLLPKRFEHIFGHSFQEISRGSITVVRDDMYFKYFEIAPEDLEKIYSCFERICLQRKKRVNYISHEDGFGFYHAVFADEKGEVLEPSVRVDYSGNMYINDVQYQVIGGTDLIPLLESISEPRITEDLCVER